MLLVLNGLLKHGDLSLLLLSEFLSSHLHVITLFDAQEKFTELHLLLEVQLVYIGFKSLALVVLILLTSLFVANFDMYSRVLTLLKILDHFLDVFDVPLVQRTE